MSPLPVVTGRQCIEILSRLGYVVVRQRGSHAWLACQGRRSLTVPLHHELDRGTLRAILRVAGVTTDEFVELLEG